MLVSPSATGVRRWFGVVTAVVVVAATLAAAPSRVSVETEAGSSPVLVYEDFWFHGEPTDQVNKVDRFAPGQTPLDARSATFDQTEPDGEQSTFQLLHGAPGAVEACTLAGSPCGAYWAGPFSGQVKGTMTVGLWMVDTPQSPAALTVYADPDWSTGKATVLAQESIFHNLGADANYRYVEIELQVNATVERELVVQVTNNHPSSLRAVEYGSAAAASGFTLPTIVEQE